VGEETPRRPLQHVYPIYIASGMGDDEDSRTCYMARVNGCVIAKSRDIQFANHRVYFPMESLRQQYFVESPKLWR
jgi:hypothetical protein